VLFRERTIVRIVRPNQPNVNDTQEWFIINNHSYSSQIPCGFSNKSDPILSIASMFLQCIA